MSSTSLLAVLGRVAASLNPKPARSYEQVSFVPLMIGCTKAHAMLVSLKPESKMTAGEPDPRQ